MSPRKSGRHGLVRIWAGLLVITALVGLLVELQFERVFHQQVSRNLVAVLDTSKLALESWNRATHVAVAGWAASGSVRRAARALAAAPAATRANHPLAAALAEDMGGVLIARGYAGYLLLNEEGQVLASGGTVPARTAPVADAWLAPLRERTSVVSAPTAEAAAPCGDDAPRLYAGARILEGSTQPLGFLLFCIDPHRELLAFLRQARQGASGETYGIDGSGRMVGDSRFEADLWRVGTLAAGTPSLLNLRLAEPLTRTPTRAAAALAARQRGDDVTGYRDYRGVEVVGAWAWSDELGFGIVTEIDRDEIFSPIFMLRGGLVLLYTLFAVLLTVTVRSLRRGAAAAERQQLFNDMLESSPLGAVVVDDAGTVYFANGRVMEMLATSREAFFAAPARRWYRAPDGKTTAIPRKRAGRSVWEIDWELQRSDGSTFPVRLSRSTIDGGGCRHYVIWIEDRSERRRVEDELRRAGAMARTASEMKSAFLANMSHEIRTPINAVLNLTRLVLDEGRLAPRQLEFLEKSLTAAEGLLALVNDVLDISKIEAGHLELELQPFQLPRVFAQVTSVLGERARQKGLALAVALAPGVPRTLVGDSLRLAQVLINLVSNAIKFTEHGGVDFRVDRLSGGADRVVLRFSVTDSGIGIPPDVLPRLFQSFVQADASVSRRYGGSGLGLAISERLVGMMGGSIEVQSAPGFGSSFSFVLTLPVADAADIADGEAVEAVLDTASLAGRRVLVAEDNAVNQLVIREHLERVGIQVVCVDDGRAAVGCLLDASGLPFDAVLMDVQMPGMDGVEATRCLRADPRTAALPIVAVTASALREERQQVLAAGMDVCLTKPYEPETLYRVLIGLLTRNGGGERAQRGAASGAEAALTTMATDSPADFDTRALAELTPDPAAQRRLAELYLESVVAAADELAAAREDADVARLAGLCHRLKSSSLLLGAVALARELEATEGLARGDAAAAALARIDELNRLLTVTGAWVRCRIENENGESPP